MSNDDMFDENHLFVRGPHKGQRRCKVGEVPQPIGPDTKYIGNMRGKCMFPAVPGSDFCKIHDYDTSKRHWEKVRRAPIHDPIPGQEEGEK